MSSKENINLGLQARELVQQQFREAFEKAGFTPSKMARELAAIAYSDIGDYFQVDEQGSCKEHSLGSIPPKKRRAINPNS